MTAANYHSAEGVFPCSFAGSNDFIASVSLRPAMGNGLDGWSHPKTGCILAVRPVENRAISDGVLERSKTDKEVGVRAIRFEFKEAKLVQALAFFSLRGVRDLTKLKAAKLLYFADKLHLNRYGRPITGDSYACMEHGPVPSISLNEMNNALEKDPEIREEEPSLLRVLEITSQRHPAFFLKDTKLFDPDIFSASDLEVLEEVVHLHGGKSAWQLREESHRQDAWLHANQFRTPGSSVPIAFERLFDQDNRAMLEAVLEDQKAEEELEDAIQRGYQAIA